jgi:hypothetical protein
MDRIDLPNGSPFVTAMPPLWPRIDVTPGTTLESQITERDAQLDVALAFGGLLGFDLTFTGEQWDRFVTTVTEANAAYERRALELDVRLGNT